MRKAVIKATGSYAPARVVPNSYFNDLLGEDVDSWLRENLNIHKRHWCSDKESCADLCEQAANIVLTNAGLKPQAIDLIIIATDTPEYVSPSTASVLQHRIGAKNAGTFDLNTACAGFVTALDVAAKYIIADDRYKNILVIGAYAMSKYLNMKDKKTVSLFGDGAGAVILSADKNTQRGFITSDLHTKGKYNSWLGIYGGGTHKPVNGHVIDDDYKLQFVHKFPKELNPEVWTIMAKELCNRINIEANEVSQYLITQLNINAIKDTMDKLNQPYKKAHTIMDRFGYTGSACIPMALDDAVSKGKIKENDMLFLIGSGGGLAFASLALRF